MPDHASGFCVYNDPAIAIAWLLEQGAERVAYVDVDVHHGDGVQEVFWDDPRVLTISLHETGTALFPGTGFPPEVGGPGAEGYAVNVALPPGTGDAGWLRAFHAIVPPLLEAFDPVVLVSQQGCDSHAEDPLAHLALSVDGQRASYLALHDLAHSYAAGVGSPPAAVATRWSTSSRGRGLTCSRSRPAAHSTRRRPCQRPGASTSGRGSAGVARPASPTVRRRRFARTTRPARPAIAVDQAIAETRSAVFGLHGIRPD